LEDSFFGFHMALQGKAGAADILDLFSDSTHSDGFANPDEFSRLMPQCPHMSPVNHEDILDLTSVELCC
jgi:hypothetical protein